LVTFHAKVHVGHAILVMLVMLVFILVLLPASADRINHFVLVFNPREKSVGGTVAIVRFFCGR
jgi:hypothetical protein